MRRSEASSLEGAVLAGLACTALRTDRDAKVVEAYVAWNYTTILNILLLALAAALAWRYFRRGGGLPMLRMMSRPGGKEAHASHAHGHA